MRGKISRSIWGIKLKSFASFESYLIKKHKQKKNKCLKMLDEMNTINVHLKKRIIFFQSSDSKLIPQETHKTNYTVVSVDLKRYEAYYSKTTFKKGLFGLSPKHVKLQLKKLKAMQEEELQKLYEELEALIQEQEKLLLEISRFQNVVYSNIESAAAYEVLEAVDQETEAVEKEKIKEELEKEEPKAESIEKEHGEELSIEEVPSEAWRKSIEEETKNRLINELREEAREELEIKQQRKLRPNVILLHKKTIPKVLQQTNQPRLTVGGTGFWDEDIEHLLFQPNDEDQAQVQFQNQTRTIEIAASVENHIESRKSPVIAEQTYHLRKKYIVGKIAGKEIRDSRGKMIAAKNTIITEELMKKADQEGKLAELIVNMSVQGVEE